MNIVQVFITLLAFPTLYLIASLLVIVVSRMIIITRAYAQLGIWAITLTFTGIIVFFGLPLLNSTVSKQLVMSMIGGWLTVIAYLMVAIRVISVSGISTGICTYTSLVGVYVMPLIVSGLSGWILYLALT